MNRDLNATQREVLTWLAEGGSTNPPKENYKHSARALANRGLAKVVRRGGVWTAALTDTGRYYAEHNTYPRDSTDAVHRSKPPVKAATTPEVRASTPIVKRSPDGHLSLKQHAVLDWVASGSPPGAFHDPAHHQTLTSLRGRGLVQLNKGPKGWVASITPDGTRRVERERARVAEKEKREAAETAERERQAKAEHESQVAAHDLLDRIHDTGRVEVGKTFNETELLRIEAAAHRLGLLPAGEKLAHEHTRMDPALGYTVYLRPDYEQRVQPRDVRPPARMPKTPHPLVNAFVKRRANVSKASIPRAGRFLQGVAEAAAELGWQVPGKPPASYSRDGEARADLELRIRSHTYGVKIWEDDERSRQRRPYVEQWDYYGGRTSKTVANKEFTPSGRLHISVKSGWEDRALLQLGDAPGAPLEDQLKVLIRKLEIHLAEQGWDNQERERRNLIRKERGDEVRAAAVEKVRHERNAKRARDQLRDRQLAQSLREYAEEVADHAAKLAGDDQTSALEWAAWLRQHAEEIDPLNGPLQVLRQFTPTADELRPHMGDWSPYGY